MIDLPISPTLLRVVRVFRIGRILRLIKVSTFSILLIDIYNVPMLKYILENKTSKLSESFEYLDLLFWYLKFFLL